MQIANRIDISIKKLLIYDKNSSLISSDSLYKEFLKIKSFLVSHFSQKKIIAIYLEKDYQYILTILAAMSVGITYIPLSKEWPEERIKQIQELSSAIVLKDDFYKTQEILSDFPALYDNDILYIMFTSGSTGEPKGVKIKREGYNNFLFWTENYFPDITSHDRMLLTTDFTFDISLLDIALLLTKNLTLYISQFNNNVYKMLYELEKYKITVHSTVPYNYSMVMHKDVYPKANLITLKHIILAGARFPNNLYHEFKEKLSETSVYNAYGPTEYTIYATAYKLTYIDAVDLDGKNVTIGKALLNTSLKVVDEELFISGKQLMVGYLNQVEKTKEVLVELDNEVYYKSGDVVYQNSEGNYFVTGRKDDTVKVVGYRVNLSDIDAYILTLPYVNNATTIHVDEEEGENYLVSYIILDGDASISTGNIKKDLKTIVPAYQIAKYVKIIDSFPLNNSGKICKHTLKNSFLNKG